MKHEFSIFNFKFQIFLLFLAISSFLFSIIHPHLAFAETVSSDNYIIEMGNLNMSAGIPSSSTYKMGLTGGQTSPGLYSSTGYRVCLGFWCAKNKIPFAFSISGLSIDFGTITPKTLNTLTNKLIVTSGGAGGYQVTARENDTLKTLAGTSWIEDTACDNPFCDETNAAVWNQNTTYGFGYNMSGNDIPATFSGPTLFRPFPSILANEDPAIVMSSAIVGKNRTATVTYQINISGSQAAGNYENYVVFVATPTY